MYDEKGELISECFSSADHISDVEADMSCKLSEDSVTKLRETIAMYPVLSWDGFRESRSADHDMLDGGDSFQFELVLEDGTVINVEGSYAHPEQFDEFILIILDICMSRE